MGFLIGGVKWNRRARLGALGGQHCWNPFLCEQHRGAPASSSCPLTTISHLRIIFQADVVVWKPLCEDRGCSSMQSPAPGVWELSLSWAELRDTKSTNTAQGLLWASGNSSQLSNTRTTEIQKFLWIKPSAWYKPNLQEPLIIQILGSIHNPWEEPCLEQAVLLSPFTKRWRIPSLSQPELHPPFQNQNFPAWLCLERALFAVHAGYFLFNLVILQN